MKSIERFNEEVGYFRVITGPLGTTVAEGRNGAFVVPTGPKRKLVIICNDSELCGWEHVSVVAHYLAGKGKKKRWKTRTPSWEEMDMVKNLFWDEEEAVMQLHPPRSDWVNNHMHCLHLWRPEPARLPDGFTDGMELGEIPLPPPEFVGFKELGTLTE